MADALSALQEDEMKVVDSDVAESAENKINMEDLHFLGETVIMNGPESHDSEVKSVEASNDADNSNSVEEMSVLPDSEPALPLVDTAEVLVPKENVSLSEDSSIQSDAVVNDLCDNKMFGPDSHNGKDDLNTLTETVIVNTSFKEELEMKSPDEGDETRPDSPLQQHKNGGEIRRHQNEEIVEAAAQQNRDGKNDEVSGSNEQKLLAEDLKIFFEDKIGNEADRNKMCDILGNITTESYVLFQTPALVQLPSVFYR